MRFLALIGLLCIGVLQSCRSESPDGRNNPIPDHDPWTELLSHYVDNAGFVNYLGFRRDSIKLNNYLNILTANPPDRSSWPDDEQLAYWINLYNAFTIKLIIKNYPVQSIKDIGSRIQIPFINSPWDIKLPVHRSWTRVWFVWITW